MLSLKEAHRAVSKGGERTAGIGEKARAYFLAPRFLAPKIESQLLR